MTSDEKVPVLNPEVAGGEKHRVRSWPTAPWLEAEVQRMAGGESHPGSVIAEVGVGAGSYARALAAPAAIRLTLDLPVQAAAQPWQWPIADQSVDLLLVVDSIHYEGDVDHFLHEAVRTLKPGKLLILAARTREDLQADGLSRFFPAAIQRALPLLTEITVVQQRLQTFGMHCEQHKALKGNLSIDESLLRAIAHRELTGLGSLTDEEFDAGVIRLREAIAEGDTAWPAHFTLLACRKAA